MPLQFYAVAAPEPSGAVAGIFIPVAALDGIESSDFSNDVAIPIKTSKAIASLLNTCERKINQVDNILGINLSQTMAIGNNSATVVITYIGLIDYFLNLQTLTLLSVPVPLTGDLTGKGKFNLQEIFTGATIINSDQAIPNEGLLVPFADLVPYGSSSTITNISSGQDNRDWIAALYRYLVYTAPARSGQTQSAITTTTKDNLIRKIIPPEWTRSENPTSGLTTETLKKGEVVTVGYRITVEYLLNQTNQTFEVNVA